MKTHPIYCFFTKSLSVGIDTFQFISIQHLNPATLKLYDLLFYEGGQVSESVIGCHVRERSQIIS